MQHCSSSASDCPWVQVPNYHDLPHDFWQVAQLLCASAVMLGTTYPFFTGWLGGLTIKQDV